MRRFAPAGNGQPKPMPDSENPLLSTARAAARQGAGLLRIGAGLLDAVAGPAGPRERSRDEPEPTAGAQPGRPKAAARPRARATTRPKDLDDVTLARKVETELFRAAGAPKGEVDVNVADGIVHLRGQVRTPAQIRELEQAARAIPEVRGVENLLHLPKTPAPTRTDTPDRQRKPAGRRSRPRSADLRTPPRASSGEVPVPGAEPSPEELARQAKGRRPAPFGSADAPAETPEKSASSPPTPPSLRSADSVESDPGPAKRA